MSVRAAVLRGLAIACIAGACGAVLDAQAAPRKSKPAVHTVTIDAARYTPAEIDVKAGDTVVWVNKDILAHTATSTAGGFDSGVIQPGKTWKYKVTKKGDFAYTCSFHPMNGRMRVK